MKPNRIQRGLLVAAIVGLLAFSGIALAGPYGFGRHMGYGNFGCPRFQEGGGPGWGVELSDEQIGQVAQLRGDFQAATADLRGELRQKELALNAELAKTVPDAAAAAALQKEISALSADLDAKRLAHRLEVRRVAPQAGYGAGFGPGPHHGMHGGRGHWWN